MPRRSFLLLLALVTVIAVIIFHRALSGEFVNWDDPSHILQNPMLTRLDADAIARIWSSSWFGLYVPVTYSAWAGVAALARLFAEPIDPAFFHALNLLLHIVNAWILGRLLLRWTRSPWALFAGLGVFLWHPLQVESVVWVSGLKDVLSTGLCLGAILVWSSNGSRGAEARETTGVRVMLLGSVLFALAMLAKPSVAALAVFPLLFLTRRNSQRETWSALILSLVNVAVAMPIVQHTRTLQASDSPTFLTLWERGIVALDALGFYVIKVFGPIGLAADYGRTPERVIALVRGGDGLMSMVVGGIFVAVGVVGAWWLRRRSGGVHPGFWFCMLALLPVLGLVPFGFQKISTVADRYMYPVMAGVAMLVAVGVNARIWERAQWMRVVMRVTAVLVLLLLGVISYGLVPNWQSTATLFERVLVVNPRSFSAHNNLGLLDVERGALDAAEVRFRKAIEANGSFSRAHDNLGVVLQKRGLTEAALPHHVEAVRVDPGYAMAQSNLGVALQKLGRLDESIEHLRMATLLDPLRADGFNNLGVSLELRGELAAAEQSYVQALRLDPNSTLARMNLGIVQEKLGRATEGKQSPDEMNKNNK